jgi:hypothetical protein
MLRGLSLALGNVRTGVRRIGGMALLFLGIHAGALWLDRFFYSLVDHLDLWLDDVGAWFLSWLSLHGGLAADTAVVRIEQFAALVELDQKEWLAVRLALVVELLLDIAVLRLAWGQRPDAGQRWQDDFKRSMEDMRDGLRAFDFQRVLAPPTLLLLSVVGALVSTSAVEPAMRNWLQAPWLVGVVPALRTWAGPAVAAMSLLLSALLVWRFVPDMLWGAWRSVTTENATPLPKVTNVRAALTWMRIGIARVLRGWWWLLPLALAVTVLRTDSTFAVLHRLQPVIEEGP